ncbi:MAG: PD40 domain-containing protein [Gemmatimonadaceae bacterium]|nr:PD40 domain-containing protein [Gemmatimonadaceae bacterium]
MSSPVRLRWSLLAALLLSAPLAAQAPGRTRLLRQPSVSERHIAFTYANNIWVVARAGGDAKRLTSFQGSTGNPELSPDGRWVAFNGTYGGNTDVYVVPVTGGEPERLTWHPAADVVQGWTPDGASIVFTSPRAAAPAGTAQTFWRVARAGGMPEPIGIPRGNQGTYSPDGKQFAYRLTTSWDEGWRNYRGGQNRPIWITTVGTWEVESPPWTDSKDIEPVWVGETVYFLSDRDWLMNVWAYDTRTKQLRQVTKFTDYDVKSLGAGAGVVVFEQAGDLHLHDPRTGTTAVVEVTATGDFPWMLPQWRDVNGRVAAAELSPTGKRVVIEARGDIFTVPAEKGDWRAITASAGSAERSPAWSPDGKWISYFSDASGEYQLVLAPQDGSGAPRTIALPDPTFYFTPVWSPDSKKLLFTDTHLRLWVVDIASGRVTQVDADQYMVPDRSMDPRWSPDSRWIAYTKRLATQLHVIYVHDTQSGRSTALTDGMSDAVAPAWDASGKHLWFLASTNFGLQTGWLDMTAFSRPTARSLYVALLRAGEPSPLLPESDEESVGAAAPARPAASTTATPTVSPPPNPVTIDFAGLANRIVAVDLPARDYSSLEAGPTGVVFFLETVPDNGTGGNPTSVLHRYQLKERKAAPFAAGATQFGLSADRRKVLYQVNGAWAIADADKAAPSGGAGRVNLSGVRQLVDPRAEYPQMLREGWRFMRDFLYVKNLHGNDYRRTIAMYEPFLPYVAHRADFNALLDDLSAEVSIGHSYVSGGDLPAVPAVAAGLLGADVRTENGRVRIVRIYTGEGWNPQLRAPLATPGVDARTGDYIVAVNGTELTSAGNLHRLLDGTANRQTLLSLNDRPTMEGARQVTVVPIPSENGLRQFAWIERNRRMVDSLSGGRLAYVYVPNTGDGGYTYFNRYFFAQQDRQGVIVDERYNGGGSAADYIIEVLARDFDGYFNNPVGERRPFTSPTAGIWGPKVMIINEMAGSGGDLMPYMFKRRRIGTLVGKRTWGGLVGTWDTPALLDGGRMIAPRGGFFDRDGKWAVENEGIAPDIDVENWPKDENAGHDAQLERAVSEAMRQLRERPLEFKPEPPAPIRSRRPDRP